MYLAIASLHSRSQSSDCLLSGLLLESQFFTTRFLLALTRTHDRPPPIRSYPLSRNLELSQSPLESFAPNLSLPSFFLSHSHSQEASLLPVLLFNAPKLLVFARGFANTDNGRISRQDLNHYLWRWWMRYVFQ